MLDMEMSQIKDEIMDSQGLFHKRSSIVEEILDRIQDLYMLQMPHDQLELIRKRFWDVRNTGDITSMHEMKDELDKIVEAKKEEQGIN